MFEANSNKTLHNKNCFHKRKKLWKKFFCDWKIQSLNINEKIQYCSALCTTLKNIL